MHQDFYEDFQRVDLDLDLAWFDLDLAGFQFDLV